MVKMDEAEKAIRHLATKWFRHTHPGVDPRTVMPLFSDFVAWMHTEGYGGYLDFRATMGPAETAEIWFDQELKQGWRN